MKKDDMFARLVENGLNFLFKAVSELREQPKYSVIHFHAAVELFIKARLMHEHWSLMVTKRQEPDWNKFVAGDFQSVSLDEAAGRLRKIVGSGLTKAELDSFKDVAKHRNKMVHFFHEADSEAANKELQQSVVRQRLKAWYFLHRLLTDRWGTIFTQWQGQISELDTAHRELHEFLDIVFENLSDEICKLKTNGSLFEDCPSCGFEAQVHEIEVKTNYESKCLVCGLLERCLRIECPDCSELVILRNEGFGVCEFCEKTLDAYDIAEILIDSNVAYVAAKETGEMLEANCSDCDSHHTIVFTENKEWICANCLGKFDSLETCGWCHELNSGNMEDSYLLGCNFCVGHGDWHNDD